MGVDNLIGNSQRGTFPKEVNEVGVNFYFAGTIEAYPKNKGKYDDD